MSKKNKFYVKKIEKNEITVSEAKKNHSLVSLFFIKNGKLIFWISLLFSITVLTIAIYFIISNIGDSSYVKYKSNGVIVNFNGTSSSILNGTPITEDFAKKVFNNSLESDSSDVGVVIKIKEVKLNDRNIIYYSDKTVLIKYNDGSYLKVYSLNDKYGIDYNGIINTEAKTKKLNGRIEKNEKLGISLLYLSDGSVEVTKNNITIFVRNNDITTNTDLFYTNLSGVSLEIKNTNNKIYYSNGIIKENNCIFIDNNRYCVSDKLNAFDDFNIMYYQNGYAEIIKDDFSIIVKNSNHICYDENSLEIIDKDSTKINFKDIMDIKEIQLDNTNEESIHYIVVLEETNNYTKHDIDKILPNDFIRFNVYYNGSKLENKKLDDNLKNNNKLEGLSLVNNTYLLCEGNIDKLSSVYIKLGLWIDYETITNKYMDSAFIGTVKVYIQSLN